MLGFPCGQVTLHHHHLRFYLFCIRSMEKIPEIMELSLNSHNLRLMKIKESQQSKLFTSNTVYVNTGISGH